MNSDAKDQLHLIRDVVDTLHAVGVSAWLFGGWGLDARIGRITRVHHDIEFWIERSDSPRSTRALISAGATDLPTQPQEESCEFTWRDIEFSTAYFDRESDGTFTPKGRWSDWVFPADSFGDVPGVLDGEPVPVMSVEGMLAMKEKFPELRHGRPWRDKDIDDVKALRTLRAEAE